MAQKFQHWPAIGLEAAAASTENTQRDGDEHRAEKAAGYPLQAYPKMLPKHPACNQFSRG